MQIIAGNTKIEKYILDGKEIYLKREDQNPSGSFKDRLIEYIWPQLLGLDNSEIVVSSSGNLAISLLYYQSHSDQRLTQKIKIFIKNNLPEIKLQKLQELAESAAAEIKISDKPKSDCFKYARENNAFWLRNSQGEDYPDAYIKLTKEIINYQEAEKLKFDSVFIATSSGTAALGLVQELLKSQIQLPVYVVQTSHINAIAKEFDQDFEYEPETMANAISDRISKRKLKMITALKQIKGGGVVVDNKHIQQAIEQLNQLLAGEFTGNAALSLAGFSKLQKKGYNLEKPLIIISGN